MKSSYELAMEKFGREPVAQLTDEQKKKIADIDSRYQSKIAEAEVMSQDKIKKAALDPSAIEQIQKDLAVEKASFRERSEREKERVRNEAETAKEE